MRKLLFGVLTLVIFQSCIGNDFILDTVEETVRISNPIQSLKVGDDYQFEAIFLNNVGMEAATTVNWTTDDPSIINISNSGLASSIAMGQTVITATVELENKVVTDTIHVSASDETVVASSDKRSGMLQTTSSYLLEGDFSLEEENGTLKLKFADNYRASTALPGLYVYLTNNPSTNNNALEIGAVQVFDGVVSYDLPSSVGINDFSHVLFYCKPFSVKVGDGAFDE